VNIPKFMKLIFSPPLELLPGQPPAQEQLAHRVRFGMALL
jgi:hypothetical protein